MEIINLNNWIKLIGNNERFSILNLLVVACFLDLMDNTK